MSTLTATVEGKQVVIDLDVDEVSEEVRVTLAVAGEEVGGLSEPLDWPDCDEDHCEHDLGGDVDAVVQSAYAKVAPENERNCDWWRSMDEPWATLAELRSA